MPKDPFNDGAAACEVYAAALAEYPGMSLSALDVLVASKFATSAMTIRRARKEGLNVLLSENQKKLMAARSRGGDCLHLKISDMQWKVFKEHMRLGYSAAAAYAIVQHEMAPTASYRTFLRRWQRRS